MRRIHWMGLLALALLPACSRLGVAWRFGPWMVERDAAERMAWPEQERPRLHEAVQAWAKVMGRQVAPALASAARATAAAVDNGQDHVAAARLVDAAQRAWDATAAAAAPPLAQLLAFKPQERSKALAGFFSAKDAKDQARWADPDHSAVAQAKQLMGTFKDYAGEPSEAQGRLIVEWARHAAFPGPAYLAWRQDRERALAKALATGADPAQLQALLQDWWVSHASRPPALRQAMDAYHARLLASLETLLASLDKDQRAYLAARLRAVAQDLDQIAHKAWAPA
ncbi:MAG TPA: hypothetical protein VNZ54_07375 [bacterium]|nr:hypothetical protein [bacterium]